MLLNVTGMTEASAIAEAVSEGRTIRYCPTAGEIEALAFLAGRYDSARILNDALVWPDGPGHDADMPIVPLLLLTPEESSQLADALRDDGVDRVPCLDESTVMARIAWAIGPSEAEPPEPMQPWIETQQLGPAMADALAAWLVSLGLKAESFVWFTGQGKGVRYHPRPLGVDRVHTLIVGFWAGWEAGRKA